MGAETKYHSETEVGISTNQFQFRLQSGFPHRSSSVTL